jgi:hypothetical protein
MIGRGLFFIYAIDKTSCAARFVFAIAKEHVVFFLWSNDAASMW